MNTVEVIAALGALVAVITQILKVTPIPTETPKIVALILAFGIVGITFITNGQFDSAHAGIIATQIGAVSISAYGLYDAARGAYNGVKKIINRS